MHYLGFVIVDEPTEKALDYAMAPFEGGHWDWYVAGGRFDGFLQGDDEMRRRRTHDGFNFDSENIRVDRNVVRAKDLRENAPVFFFVADGEWIERGNFLEWIEGHIVQNSDFDARLKAALTGNRW